MQRTFLRSRFHFTSNLLKGVLPGPSVTLSALLLPASGTGRFVAIPTPFPAGCIACHQYPPDPLLATALRLPSPKSYSSANFSDISFDRRHYEQADSDFTCVRSATRRCSFFCAGAGRSPSVGCRRYRMGAHVLGPRADDDDPWTCAVLRWNGSNQERPWNFDAELHS